MAEWLGSALQKLLQRFESARYLKVPRSGIFCFNMLTKDEQQFLDDWSVQRTRKRKAGATLGFRLAVLVVLGIFISIITSWHKAAMMELRSDSSTILVIVIAAVAIVIFITVFAGRYQWEQREQRYKELVAKKRAADKTASES